MQWVGKIICGVIGFFLIGPIGLILGILLGHIVDQSGFKVWQQGMNTARTRQQIQHTFFNATFLVMGHLAKADGRVSENEIRVARHVMQQMSLTEHLKQEAIRLFNEGKSPDFNLNATLDRLKQACLFQPSLLRIFLEIQMQVVSADSQQLNSVEKNLLHTICQRLGMEGFFQSYHQHQHNPSPDPQYHLHASYKILGISATANNAEIKRAYRRLMSQHHPDKLIAKGLPPEMIKMATEKTQNIKQAYEQVCRARGIN